MSTEDFNVYAALRQVHYGCKVILKRCRLPSPVETSPPICIDTEEENDQGFFEKLQIIDENIGSPEKEPTKTNDSHSVPASRTSNYVPSVETKIKMQETLKRVAEKNLAKEKKKCGAKELHPCKKKKHWPPDNNFVPLGDKSKMCRPSTSTETYPLKLNSNKIDGLTESLINQIYQNPNLTMFNVKDSKYDNDATKADSLTAFVEDCKGTSHPTVAQNSERNCPSTVAESNKTNSSSKVTEAYKINSPPKVTECCKTNTSLVVTEGDKVNSNSVVTAGKPNSLSMVTESNSPNVEMKLEKEQSGNNKTVDQKRESLKTYAINIKNETVELIDDTEKESKQPSTVPATSESAPTVSSKVGKIKVKSLKDLTEPSTIDWSALLSTPSRNSTQSVETNTLKSGNTSSIKTNKFQHLILTNAVIKEHYNIMIEELKTIAENQSDSISKKKKAEVAKINFPRFREAFKNCLLKLQSLIPDKESLEQEKSAVVRVVVKHMLKKFQKKTILKAMMHVLYYNDVGIDSLITSGNMCNAIDNAHKEFEHEKVSHFSKVLCNQTTNPSATTAHMVSGNDSPNDRPPPIEPLPTGSNVNQNFYQKPRQSSSKNTTADHLLNVMHPSSMLTNTSLSLPTSVTNTSAGNIQPVSRQFSSNANIQSVARTDPRLNATNVFPLQTARDSRLNNMEQAAFIGHPQLQSLLNRPVRSHPPPYHPPPQTTPYRDSIPRIQQPKHSQVVTSSESAQMLTSQPTMMHENPSEPYYVSQYRQTMATSAQPMYNATQIPPLTALPNATPYHTVPHTFSQPFTNMNPPLNYSLHVRTRDPRMGSSLETGAANRGSVIHQVPSTTVNKHFVNVNVNANFLNQQPNNSVPIVQNAIPRTVTAAAGLQRECPVSNASENSQSPLSVPYVNSSVSPSNPFDYATPDVRDLTIPYPSNPFMVEQPISVPIVQSTCHTPETCCDSNANILASEPMQKIGFEENVTEFTHTTELLKELYQKVHESYRNDNVFG